MSLVNLPPKSPQALPFIIKVTGCLLSFPVFCHPLYPKFLTPPPFYSPLSVLWDLIDGAQIPPPHPLFQLRVFATPDEPSPSPFHPPPRSAGKAHLYSKERLFFQSVRQFSHVHCARNTYRQSVLWFTLIRDYINRNSFLWSLIKWI